MASLWHVDIGTALIYELDPADGTVLRSFPAPDGPVFNGSPLAPQPTGLAWDGAYLWCADNAFRSGAGAIRKIDPETGAVVASFDRPAPLGLAWDGSHLWSFDNLDVSAPSLYRLDPGDGSVVSSIPAPTDVSDIAWDGIDLWAARDPFSAVDTVVRIDPASGAILQSFPAPDLLGGTNANPGGLTWDGTHLWIAVGSSDTIYRLNPADGSVVDSIPAPGDSPMGLAWATPVTTMPRPVRLYPRDDQRGGVPRVYPRRVGRVYGRMP